MVRKQFAMAKLPRIIWMQSKRIKNSLSKSLSRDFSQANETSTIRKILKVGKGFNGYFVEVGANDGITSSTTLGLLKDGWAGLAVEANPTVFQKLQLNWLRFSRVKLVCAAVALRPGPIKLWFAKNDSAGMMSTISTDDSEWFREVRSEQNIEVPGVTLMDLLKTHSVPHSFDLLHIDAEGMDYAILSTLDFNEYHPRMVVTENYEPTNEQKCKLLEIAGYTKKAEKGCNTFWLSNTESF